MLLMVQSHPQCRRPGLDPCGGNTPWRKSWQPTPVFLSGKSHGQRSLAGYSPRGLKMSDTKTFHLHRNTHFSKLLYLINFLMGNAHNIKSSAIKKAENQNFKILFLTDYILLVLVSSYLPNFSPQISRQWPPLNYISQSFKITTSCFQSFFKIFFPEKQVLFIKINFCFFSFLSISSRNMAY